MHINILFVLSNIFLHNLETNDGAVASQEKKKGSSSSQILFWSHINVRVHGPCFNNLLVLELVTLERLFLYSESFFYTQSVMGKKGTTQYVKDKNESQSSLFFLILLRTRGRTTWSQEVSSASSGLLFCDLLSCTDSHTAILKNFVFGKKYFHLKLSCLRSKIVPYLVLRYFIFPWMERRKWCPALRIPYLICSLWTRLTSCVILFFFPNPLMKDSLCHGFLVVGNVMRCIYIQ